MSDQENGVRARFAAAMGGTAAAQAEAGEMERAFGNRITEARRLTEIVRESGELPLGHAVLPCPSCGVGSVVGEAANDWPCTACELLLQPCRCGSCGTPAVLTRDPFSERQSELRGWCETCKAMKKWWHGATLADVLVDTRMLDTLPYGAERVGSLLFEGRRVLQGKILALEGVSGLAVGTGIVVLDRDAVHLVVGKARVQHRFDYTQITRLQVAGRGEFVTKTGGGWVGGGFGLSGALQGAFMAEALNFLTTRKLRHVESLLHLGWNGGGLTLLNQVYAPERLAVLVEPAVARLNALQAASGSGKSQSDALASTPTAEAETVVARIQKLETLRDLGLISPEEYADQRSRILAEI